MNNFIDFYYISMASPWFGFHIKIKVFFMICKHLVSTAEKLQRPKRKK